MDQAIDVSIIVEQLKEAGKDISKQIPALVKLGEFYSRKAKETQKESDFTKANALYNAALVRSRLLDHETDHEDILRRIIETYREFLQAFANDEEINRDEIRNEILSHKQFVADERRRLRENVDEINSCFTPNATTVSEEKDEVFNIHADKIHDVFRDVQDMYIRLVGMLVKECESRLGKAPCKYAVIALGSVARMEATPFSDLEFAILYSDPVIGEKINYFRVLTHFLHLKVINLGETILPAVGIECLNDFQSTDPASNWFYDSQTPRGISFDGVMPWASKTALGRATTKNKPALELIRTPENMAELQDENIALKEGYHLAEIMSRTILLYGEQALLDEYNERVAGKLNAKSSVSETNLFITVGRSRGIKQLMLDTATYDPYYSYLGKHCVVGALFDAKKQFYRLISLLLSDLGLVFDIRCPSPWQVISVLQTRGIIAASEATNIKVCLAIANEIRLKTYFANDGQKELLSPVPQFLSTAEQSTDVHQPPIFRFSDEEILIRLLSASNDMYQRCHNFCSKFIRHGEIDISIFQSTSPPSSQALLKGNLYFRLQNFSKALAWMKSEPKESRHYSLSLNDQGIIYKQYGDYQKSVECFEEALKVHYENEMSNLNVVACLGNLALGRMHMGEYKVAKRSMEKAIKEHVEIYGKDIDTITLSRIKMDLGLTYFKMGDHRLAIEAFLEVQMMHSRLSADESIDMDAMHLNMHMALVFSELEEHAQALKYVEQALVIARKLFDEQGLSCTLGYIYTNAGTVYEHCDLNEEALAWYKRSLELFQLVYGDSAHPGKVSCLNNLGNFVSRRYRTTSGVKYLEEALNEARAVYHGNPHPLVALTLSNLGVALKRADKSKEALPYFEEAKEILDQVLGKEHAHPTTSDVLDNLGTIYQDLGDLKKALQYYKDVVEMNKIIYGEDGVHDAMATVCSNIGCVSEELGDFAQAKEYYTKAVAIDRKISSTKNTCPGLVSSLYGLSSICEVLGEHDEALKHLEEAREVAKSAGSRDFMAVTVLLKLGQKYMGMECIDEGKMCFQEIRGMLGGLADNERLGPAILGLLDNFEIESS